ncbi:MAG TPA: zinc ribbon domain-containing protein [Fimbriimonas sp.]|nr:zinc ribbon domain-containing protein [Fimbriimonas sp.]
MNATTIAVFGCLVWLPLAVWILAVIQWTIGGDVDPLTGVVGIFVALGLGYAAVSPPVPIVSPIACGIVFLTVLTYPAFQLFLHKHQTHSIDIEVIEKAYRGIGQHPANPLVKFKLAEAVYRVGLIGHAVAIGDAALANVPERIATEEHRVLKRWKSSGVPPNTLQPIPCVDCQTPCEPGWTHCRNCGGFFLLDRSKGKILPTGVVRKLTAIWVTAVVLIVGIPSLTALPTPSSYIGMGGTVIVAAGVILIAFRKPRQTA